MRDTMRGRRRAAHRAAILAFAALAAATQGRAQPTAAGPAPLAAALTGDAKNAYERARTLYQNGDAGSAFVYFERAHDASGDPRLLWNMAACAKAQRRYARAHQLVTEYLRAAHDTLTAEGRAEGEETRQALRALFSAVELRGAPAGARVQVDGDEVGRAPVAGLTLDAGSHIVRLEKEEHETFTTRVVVAGAAPLTIDVKMPPRPSTARLAVTAATEDAIRVDGQQVKLGRWDGVVTPGAHVIDVTAPGKAGHRAIVEVGPGSVRTLDVVLDPERRSSLWPWVLGGVALSAATVVGAYVLFHPRTETNPLLEGGLGTAVLPTPPMSAP